MSKVYNSLGCRDIVPELDWYKVGKKVSWKEGGQKSKTKEIPRNNILLD